MRKLLLGVVALGSTSILFAQQPAAASSNNAYRARVFITDSKSWEMSGGFGGSSDAFGGSEGGGARPQTAEIIKTFGQRCPDVVVNNRQERADYVVLLDHEGGKAAFLRDNKVAVFNHDGDSILSTSTRSLGNAVKNSCDAIVNDWRVHGVAVRAAQAAQSANQGSPALVSTSAVSRHSPRLSVSSNPVAADIELDGAFVGNTPSTIEVPPGDHVVAIVKSGYQRWERKVKVMGGTVNISADLQTEQK
ncbi:MAG TPA: PEGA domain-containing protein [Terriglobales bacterium]|jgi:hypothetical protein|nr:PEGA domain-containing protein [Terriglobales bacterium]